MNRLMEEDKTRHLRDKTVRLSGGDRIPRVSGDRIMRAGHISLSPGRSGGYQLNDILYHSLQLISEGTGEAQVYQVEHQGRPYVLKLYYPEAHPNRQILNVLKRVGRSGVLVELIDYGTYADADTGEVRDYELMEYAGGGSLAELRLEKDADRLRSIAMQAAISLDFCHQNGIIHRDVKPANFLFADESRERLVLSDFGIAMFCVDPRQPSPSEQTRTPVYAAPELYQNVIDGIVEIDCKVDFYSLGMVLLNLWLGDEFIKGGDERTFMKRKSKGDLPYPDDLPPEMLTLLRGLTIVDPAKRWGFEEIKSWYRGEIVSVDQNVVREMNIVFSSAQRLLARSPQELALLLRDYPDLGIKFLYSGRVTGWLYESDLPEMGIEVDRIVEVHCPKNQQEGLLAACYTIDPEMPYQLMCGAEGEKPYTVECSTPDEIIRAYREHKLTAEARKSLTGYGFLAWFRYQDEPVIYEELKSIILQADADADIFFDVIYRLNKRISYNFYFPDESDRPDYCFSAKQIAEYINGRMGSAYYRQKYADHLTGEGVESPDETLRQAYAYFGSKGWTDAIQWVKSCFDIHSPENQEKCSAYTIAIATYRGLKGLGFSPYYLFPICGKKVFLPEELAGIPKSEIRTEMERGRLKEWLTVFYHEDPYITFQEKYDYEKQVKAYLLKLKELNPQEPYVVKYNAAKSQVKKSAGQIRKARAIFLGTRWLLSVLTLIPLLLLAILCVVKKFPVSDSILPLLPWMLFVVTFVGSALWQFVLNRFNYLSLFRWKELRNVIFFYYLSWAAFYFIPGPYAWIYMLCFAVGLMIHVARKPLLTVKTPSVEAEKGFEAEELEALFYAFKDTQLSSSPDSQQELNAKRAGAFSKATRRFVRIIVPTLAVAWVLLASYVYYHPTLSLIGGQKLPGYERFITVKGSNWKGVVGKEVVLLGIDSVDPFTGALQGSFGVMKGEVASWVPFVGMLQMEEGKLTFEVTDSELPGYGGVYTGTFNEGNTEVTGTHVVTGRKATTEFFVHRQKGLFRLQQWWKTVEVEVE